MINRTRVSLKHKIGQDVPRAFDLIRLKVAAGGCGGCGLTADPHLMAMGIESFFVCSLLILHDLQKSEKSKNRS
jgi:molybdopterin/thiamine biosynthesis adenylyltransferase